MLIVRQQARLTLMQTVEFGIGVHFNHFQLAVSVVFVYALQVTFKILCVLVMSNGDVMRLLHGDEGVLVDGHQ